MLHICTCISHVKKSGVSEQKCHIDVLVGFVKVRRTNNIGEKPTVIIRYIYQILCDVHFTTLLKFKYDLKI